MKMYDVCVIGSGFAGLATAYELARAGQKVALVEAGGLCAGASTANTSMLLLENTREAEVFKMCLDGVRDFETLHEELGEPTGFGDLEFLSFFTEDGEEDTARGTQEFFRSQGFHDYNIISADEVARRQPLLKMDGVRGAALFKQWLIDPMKTAFAYFSRCRALGVDWYPRSPVTGFTHKGGTVTGAVTPNGVIMAGQYMVTAGAWTRELLQTAGIDLPEYFIHGAAMVLERTPTPAVSGAVSPFTSHRIVMERRASELIQKVGWENMPQQEANEFVVVPDTNGNLIIAQRSYASPKMTTQVPAQFLRDMCESLRRWFPSLDTQRVIRSWITPVPFVLDGQGFFGFLKPYNNLAVSSGYGSVLIMAPVLGKMGLRLLTGQPQEYNVSGLNPHRFERQAKP